MIAYFIAFLIIGLPICWAEWAMGRHGGSNGFNSSPGILGYIAGKPGFRYVGIIGVLIPVIIYMYYVYIEAWCLGYAVNFIAGNMEFQSIDDAGKFWKTFIGFGKDGSAVGFGMSAVGGFLIVVFILNFYLIYRGISKGIEFFCKYAMPTLVVLAFIILIRVLTLGTPVAEHPDRSVDTGLGFMWNPTKIELQERGEDGRWSKLREVVDEDRIAAARAEAASAPDKRVEEITAWKQLRNPQLWLAAAGQIFFSLSVGFGVIITYSSYLSKKDDVVLSGLAATSANEFCEVGLGGLITLPAAVAFLGVSGVAGMGTFGLGFNVLPMVFSNMPFGPVFGALFFFLLFLAAVTSSLSMLQPGIAFLEEALSINRKQSVALLGLVTAIGCGFVVYFSKDLKALDTMDFWVGTFLIFVLSTIQIIVFGWMFGIDRGWKEAHKGAAMRIPRIFRPIMLYVTPSVLIVIFSFWVIVNVFGYDFGSGSQEVSGYVKDLFTEPNTVARMSAALILVVAAFFAIVIASSKRYKKEDQ